MKAGFVTYIEATRYKKFAHYEEDFTDEILDDENLLPRWIRIRFFNHNQGLTIISSVSLNYIAS